MFPRMQAPTTNLLIAALCGGAAIGCSHAPAKTASAAPAPAAHPVSTVPSGIDMQFVDSSVSLKDDFYRHVNGKWLDSFEKAESKATLDALLGAVKNQPTWSFAIEGHTDNVGDDTHNQVLSTKRAEAVKAYLVRAGIEATRLSTQGFGATRPVGSNDTSSGRAQNRRVEIVKK
jgi:outer membrane protein OmpA-like peptidoglycan-associated protein